MMPMQDLEKEGKKYLRVSTDGVRCTGCGRLLLWRPPPVPHSPYSSSKASADMFVMAFHDTYAREHHPLLQHTGPYQFRESSPDDQQRQAIASSCPSTATVCRSATGCMWKITAHIDMVANGGKIGYNVGDHNERPNIFIVKTIINQLRPSAGRGHQRTSSSMWPTVGPRPPLFDPTKIKNDLGWYPETPFERGIVLTIDWYLNHQEWMDHVTSGDYQNYYQDMYKNK